MDIFGRFLFVFETKITFKKNCYYEQITKCIIICVGSNQLLKATTFLKNIIKSESCPVKRMSMIRCSEYDMSCEVSAVTVKFK